MADLHSASAMARETAEIPVVAERLLGRADLFGAIAQRIEQVKPRAVVFCCRGSSGHVGVYLRYLFETRLGMLGSASAPSVMTAYERPPDMRDVLFIVISQSGQSPDLVTATRVARNVGALTLAIVNDDHSPAAAAAETVVLSMIAGARLVAGLERNDHLIEYLERLPSRLSRALNCDWSSWANAVADAAATYVVGRGYALGCVREIALKVSETLRVPGIGHSAAELRHGPWASITSSTPVLVLRQNDQTASAVDGVIRDLSDTEAPVFTAGGASGILPWIGDDHPACDPVLMLVPAYRAIERVARERGFDPDNPPHLKKVTYTL